MHDLMHESSDQMFPTILTSRSTSAPEKSWILKTFQGCIVIVCNKSPCTIPALSVAFMLKLSTVLEDNFLVADAAASESFIVEFPHFGYVSLFPVRWCRVVKYDSIGHANPFVLSTISRCFDACRLVSEMPDEHFLCSCLDACDRSCSFNSSRISCIYHVGWIFGCPWFPVWSSCWCLSRPDVFVFRWGLRTLCRCCQSFLLCVLQFQQWIAQAFLSLRLWLVPSSPRASAHLFLPNLLLLLSLSLRVAVQIFLFHLPQVSFRIKKNNL